MEFPVQIAFRHMDHSAALEAHIRERAEGLSQYCDRIIQCEVVVEERHRRHHQGNLVHVRVKVLVPGKTIVVARDPELHHAHEDPYVAVRDAFDATQRQLEDYVRIRSQHVKRHEEMPQGVVSELVPAQDHGRIATDQGRDIYFHRHSVEGDAFDSLEVGTPVRFLEESGEEGPQAIVVKVIKGE